MKNFNMNMDEAPKDRVIEVYEPKDGDVYGPEIHSAVWSDEHNDFIGVDCDDIDPFDIIPHGWRELSDN
jgi:hypothetical protein